MSVKTYSYPSNTGVQRDFIVWTPDSGDVRAVVQLSHGMAEYILRYDGLARALNAAGYAVVGHDHAGHGEKANIKGHFADEDGWNKVIEDIYAVQCEAKKLFPDKKFVLLGHSMGSFAAREFALRHGDTLSALIICGTGWHPRALCNMALTLAHTACVFGKRNKPAKLVDKIVNAANNNTGEKQRTPFDWLNRDDKEVDKYIQDPLCGFTFTGQAFCDMFGGLRELSKTERLQKLPKGLPVLFISGTRDPVGGMGKGVNTVYGQFRDAGVKDVRIKLYDGARHELFNEVNKEEVTRDCIAWLDEVLKG